MSEINYIDSVIVYDLSISKYEMMN